MKAEGIKVARCTVKRLMKQQGKAFGVAKARLASTAVTIRRELMNLVNRNCNAHRPNQLWVAGFTYIKTISGWVYTAFIIDMFARAIVSWKVSNRMNMVMAALN